MSPHKTSKGKKWKASVSEPSVDFTPEHLTYQANGTSVSIKPRPDVFGSLMKLIDKIYGDGAQVCETHDRQYLYEFTATHTRLDGENDGDEVLSQVMVKTSRIDPRKISIVDPVSFHK